MIRLPLIAIATLAVSFASAPTTLGNEPPSCKVLQEHDCCEGTNYTCSALCSAAGCCPGVVVQGGRNDKYFWPHNGSTTGYDNSDIDASGADKQCWFHPANRRMRDQLRCGDALVLRRPFRRARRGPSRL